MAKNDSKNSSDLDFIKEVEELKLKQKLLVESLKKKNDNEQNKLFLEINSKLDFLVNIFNEANKTGEEEEGEEEKEDQFNPIYEKIDELSKNLEKKLTSIENRIEKIENKSAPQSPPKQQQQQPQQPSNNQQSNASTNNQSQSKTPKDMQTPPDPPVPGFESKIENADKEGKKKKKWF